MPLTALRKIPRKCSTLLLITIYALLVLSPLAPLAMQSARIAHAVTGQCSGDCAIDGCSLESRVSHTCCCWQKKQQQSIAAQTSQNERCALQTAVVPMAGNGGCCPPAPPPVATCCGKTVEQQDDATAAPTTRSNTQDSLPVYKCACPCGDGNELAQWNSSSNELVPYAFSGCIAIARGSTYPQHDPQRLSSRHGDPPDPPPKLSSHT